MIFRAAQNHARAVDLLQQHNAHHLMRKRHFRKREELLCRFFHAPVQTARRADNKRYLFAPVAERADFLCERFRGALLPFHGERKRITAATAQNILRFLCYRGAFGQRTNLRFTKAGEPLGILRNGVPPIAFL